MGMVWDLQEINFSQWSRPEAYSPPHQARRCAPVFARTLSWQRAVKNPGSVKGVFRRGSGAPDTSWCSQNKTSRSNRELKVSTGGEEEERGAGGGRSCVRADRQSEWEAGLCIINPMNSEDSHWLSEVFVHLKARTILSAALSLKENLKQRLFSPPPSLSPYFSQKVPAFLLLG